MEFGSFPIQQHTRDMEKENVKKKIIITCCEKYDQERKKKDGG